MIQQLLKLHEADLQQLCVALRAGRLVNPFGAISLQRVVSSEVAQQLSPELRELADAGFSAHQIATLVDALLADRALRPRAEDQFELVTTGPEPPGVTNRDTRVVVRDLFASANTSVIVVGYAVYQGQQVFKALAERMASHPALDVQLFLDVQRPPGDTSAMDELVRRFVARFKSSQWPLDGALPRVHYDPRSLDMENAKRACLHAKCIVVDRHTVFISSANFTEAAQERNIEVGLLVQSPSLAERIIQHFTALVGDGHLIRLL